MDEAKCIWQVTLNENKLCKDCQHMTRDVSCNKIMSNYLLHCWIVVVVVVVAVVLLLLLLFLLLTFHDVTKQWWQDPSDPSANFQVPSGGGPKPARMNYGSTGGLFRNCGREEITGAEHTTRLPVFRGRAKPWSWRSTWRRHIGRSLMATFATGTGQKEE